MAVSALSGRLERIETCQPARRAILTIAPKRVLPIAFRLLNQSPGVGLMQKLKPYLSELTRALVVLALILLNLGYQAAPAVAFDGLAFTSAAVVNCGFSDDPDQGDHLPCHACRVGADIILPPAPTSSEPLHLDVSAAEYFLADDQTSIAPPPAAYHSRGPPLLS